MTARARKLLTILAALAVGLAPVVWSAATYWRTWRLLLPGSGAAPAPAPAAPVDVPFGAQDLGPRPPGSEPSPAAPDPAPSPVPGLSLAERVAAGDTEGALARLAGAASIEEDDPQGTPILVLASDWGDPALAVVRALLDKGADARSAHGGLTAAHAAARSGGLAVLEALRAAGADLHARDGELGTPLELAAAEGHLEVVRALLAAAPDEPGPDAPRAPLRRTALARAARSGHAEVVRLLTAGARATAAERAAALVEACAGGSAAAAEVLLDAQVPPDARGPGGATPLHAAAEAGAEEAVRLLIARGARLDDPGPGGEPPVVAAGRRGHHAVVDLLLARGAGLPADPVRRALLSRAERQPDGRCKVIRPAPTPGGWDGPVWDGYGGLTLFLPATAFVNPLLPDWNGQVLAQTHGLVEGDEVGAIYLDRIERARLGRLRFPGVPFNARYELPVRTPSGAFALGLVVHPEVLRSAGRVLRGRRDSTIGPEPGDERSPAPPWCWPLPEDFAPRGAECDQLRVEGAKGATSVDVVRPIGQAAGWIRATVAGRSGPWTRMAPGGPGELKFFIEGRDGAADWFVLEDRRDGHLRLTVVRIGPDLALEVGRAWEYPPPAAAPDSAPAAGGAPDGG